MNTYFLYTRKSTDVEDKQVLSIEAQLVELREFAVREGLEIVAELVEKQSAKTPGRPIFNDMIRRIEAGEATGILAWHPDRLARNSVDGGRIIYLLDTQVIKMLKFPRSWFENTPQGKLMLHNDFGFSKYYVDSLSENTKRGLRQKVRRGEFPCLAPFGYLNDYRTKKLIVDRKRAPLVKQAFERYATGTATLDTVRQFFADEGAHTANGKLVGRHFISHILSNPIYYGHFRYTGEVHEGAHTPIISKALFDKAQAILNSRWRYSPQENDKPPKALVGLLQCAECGSAITAEVQKGHTYYRCTKKNKALKCSQPYIREEALETEITELLAPFTLRAEWADEMLTRVKEDEQAATQSAALLIKAKRQDIDAITSRLQRVLDSFLDEVLEREEYTKEKARLMSRKKTLEEEIAHVAKGQNLWLEPMKKWILAAKNMGQTTVTASLTQKKVLARQVFGSNLVLDRKKARGSCVKPWSLLVENSPSGGMVP